MAGQGVCTGVAGARVAKYCGLGQPRKAARKNLPVQRFGGQLQSCRAYLGPPPPKKKLLTDVSAADPNAPGQRDAKATISSNQTSLELLRVGMLAVTLQLVLVETGGPVFPGPKRVTQLGGSTGGSTRLSEPTAKLGGSR